MSEAKLFSDFLDIQKFLHSPNIYFTHFFRGGQGFAAFGCDFEGTPPPLDVFDTFPK